MALVFAVLAALTWGTGDFFGGLLSRDRPSEAIVPMSQLAGLVLLGVLGLALPPDASPSAGDVVAGLGGGVLGGLGLVLFYRALATGTMGAVAPVAAVCTALVPLAVGAVQGERPGLAGLAGIACGIAGVWLLASTTDDEAPSPTPASGIEDREHRRVGWRGPGLGIAAGLLFGSFVVLLDRTSSSSGLVPLQAARAASIVLFVSLAWIRRVPLRASLTPSVAAVGVLDAGANVFNLVALRLGQLGQVGLIGAFYPAATVVLARIVLAERMGPHQRLGLALAAAALALIAA